MNNSKIRKRRTPFIHKNAVKRAIHMSGLKSSAELEQALDEIIAIQISQACAQAIEQNKKVLRREMITILFV